VFHGDSVFHGRLEEEKKQKDERILENLITVKVALEKTVKGSIKENFYKLFNK
jgi:hypothetical protein